MNIDAVASSVFQERARRAYELGRLRGGLLRASVIAVAAVIAGGFLVGARVWTWAPLTFFVWLGIWWRGGALLRGAHYGLVAGAITFLLPLSILRPCCRPDVDGVMPNCTMPGMCVLAGALVGLPLAALLLRKRETLRVQLGAGMMLGVLSLAALKCSALFAGEALGLLGGLALGIVAASLVDVFVTRERT